MDHEVLNPVLADEFIVMPENEIEKVVIKGNASPSIEGLLGGPPMSALPPF